MGLLSKVIVVAVALAVLYAVLKIALSWWLPLLIGFAAGYIAATLFPIRRARPPSPS